MGFKNSAPGCCGCTCSVREICLGAYSLADACDAVAALGPDPDCSVLYGGLAGVPFTIVRIWYDDPIHRTGPHEVPYVADTTDSLGKFCVEVPDTVADPTIAPTVDPVGGGTSGGTLGVGTYRTTYAWENHWGKTPPAPDSGEFQVGIPDAEAWPLLPVPAFASTATGAGGLLQAGTYVARHVFTSSSGHNKSLLASAPFTVATLGDIPTLTIPPLSKRPNADGVSLYIGPYDEDAEDGGPTRLYRTGITGTSVALDAAYDNTAALAPTTNTSAKNIPRVTFSAGGDQTRVFARFIGPLGTFVSCKNVVATANPMDIGGTLGSTCPGALNTTWMGDYKLRVHPEDCNTQVALRTLDGTHCPTPFFAGFCCFAHEIQAVDHDGGDPVTVEWDCRNPDACTDQDGNPVTGLVTGLGVHTPASTNFSTESSEWVGPCLPDPIPCPEPIPPVPYPCSMASDGTGTVPPFTSSGPRTQCIARADGYYDSETLCVPAPCAVPGIRTTAEAPIEMYSTASWVLVNTGLAGFGCCGDPWCGPALPRRKGMFPRTLFAHIDFIDGVTGGTQDWELAFIGAGSIGRAVTLTWGTGCIGGAGGWGIAPSCLPGNPPFGDVRTLRGWCAKPYGSPPACDPYPGYNAGYTFPQRYERDTKVFYRSSRISWTLVQEPGPPFGSGGCHAFLTWENFWDGACASPGGGAGPQTSAASGFCAAQHAVGAAFLCEEDCPCGLDDINDDWLAGVVLPTGSASVSGTFSDADCRPVSWSAANAVTTVFCSGVATSVSVGSATISE